MALKVGVGEGEAQLVGIGFMSQNLRTPVFADGPRLPWLLFLTQVPPSSDTERELARTLWKSVWRRLKTPTSRSKIRPSYVAPGSPNQHYRDTRASMLTSALFTIAELRNQTPCRTAKGEDGKLSTQTHGTYFQPQRSHAAMKTLCPVHSNGCDWRGPY